MIALEKKIATILKEAKYLSTPSGLIKVTGYNEETTEIKGYRILNDIIAVDFEWSDYLDNLGDFGEVLLLSKEEFEKELDIELDSIKKGILND